jgi:hypothetical protein
LVSPILVRPVREQLEHDRIIRLLQAKCKRRYDTSINPGAEQNVPVGGGASPVYPDLVLQSTERSKRLQAVVEVETGESVNHLEALAEWAHMARLRTAFHLYVPGGMVDVARRLCDDNHIRVSEIWSYHTIGEDVRFTLVHRNRELPAASPPASRTPRAASPLKSSSPAKRPSRRSRSAARGKAAAKKPARPQKRR